MIRAAARQNSQLAPCVLLAQVKSRLEGSGVPGALTMMRNVAALRQAYEREKKKLLRSSRVHEGEDSSLRFMS
jgi:hypothetical protein